MSDDMCEPGCPLYDYGHPHEHDGHDSMERLERLGTAGRVTHTANLDGVMHTWDTHYAERPSGKGRLWIAPVMTPAPESWEPLKERGRLNRWFRRVVLRRRSEWREIGSTDSSW